MFEEFARIQAEDEKGNSDIFEENDTENVVENVVEVFSKATKEYLNNCSKRKRETAQKIIAAVMRDDSTTIAEMASAADTTDRNVQRYLKEFQEAGILSREGSDTSGKWILR